MQQTEKRGLNIIERDDAFSPEALNDNTRKIEAALDAYEGKIDAQVSALDKRVKVFEARRFAYGTYRVPVDTTVEISTQIGFTPIMVIAHQMAPGGLDILALPGDPSSITNFLRIVEGGFVSACKSGIDYAGTFNYFAFG